MSKATCTGRVLRSQSGQVWAQTEQGVIHCTLRGRLKRERRVRTDLAVIGDHVLVTRLEAEGEGVIEAVEPRKNRFARRQPGPRGAYKEDVLVANLDHLFVVFACSRPAMSPRVLDRFLVVAELDALPVTIVANKIDEVERAEAERQFAPYAQLGYPVLFVSAASREGVGGLEGTMLDRVSAMVGPSGVGKSSLLNALSPGLGLAVGEIRETLDKGRHTTRVAQLHPLPKGGWVADTPGIRELASFSLPQGELASCFPEMRPFTRGCRFPSCTHEHEPDCAVRDALARGEVSEARYDSYLRILRDEQRDDA